MEKLCFKYWRQIARSTRAGLACILSLSAPLIVTPTHAQESAVQKELSRRLNNARRAHELLKSGDSSYQKQDYKAAVQDYSEAFQLLPVGALNHELRSAAAVRYATAATERSRALAKGGSYDEARVLLDTVLKPGIAPSHIAALKLKQQIDDPIRYNHAITPEHVQDVVKVGRLLREAEGFYSLGQYDRAHTVYQAVLQIDPFNKAARRSMEKIAATQSDYYRAAYDHTRASMLENVDKTWELYVPAADNTLPSLLPSDSPSFAPDLRDKLAGILVETIDLDNVSLDEALDFIRLQSRLGDAPNTAGEQTGINVVLNLGNGSTDMAKAVKATRVTLKAQQLPLSKVLDYVTDQTRTQWRIDGVGVIVTPIGSMDEALISKTFRVPPNFLSSASSTKNDEADNVFGDDSDTSGGKLPTKISITDFLKQSGVTFPDGASSQYLPSSNSLTVHNTSGNIDLIDQVVAASIDDEPVQVVVRTTILRISEEKLKELSFDWAINPVGLGGGTFLGGGSTGNGNVFGDLATTIGSAPLTSGLRSGDSAIPADGIALFLNSATAGFSAPQARAPGILSLRGVYNGLDIQMMMRGLDQKKAGDIMVKPSTVSRSGERSKIEVIREFIYATEYEPPELPSAIGSIADDDDDDDGDDFIDIGGDTGEGSTIFPVTPSHPTAFETRNLGITLEIEPTVGPNKKFIELSLRPEFVEFEGFVNYGSPIESPSTDAFGSPIQVDITANRILMPVFKTIKMPNSTIHIQDGATVVIGGMMQERKVKVEDKVPFLGSIPLAGRLFRSESSRNFSEAIIITVNAELVDPTGAKWRDR